MKLAIKKINTAQERFAEKNITIHELEQKWIIRKVEIENKVQNFAVSNTDQKHEKLLLVLYGACAGKQTLIDQLNKDGEVRSKLEIGNWKLKRNID